MICKCWKQSEYEYFHHCTSEAQELRVEWDSDECPVSSECTWIQEDPSSMIENLKIVKQKIKEMEEFIKKQQLGDL